MQKTYNFVQKELYKLHHSFFVEETIPFEDLPKKVSELLDDEYLS